MDSIVFSQSFVLSENWDWLLRVGRSIWGSRPVPVAMHCAEHDCPKRQTGHDAIPVEMRAARHGHFGKTSLCRQAAGISNGLFLCGSLIFVIGFQISDFPGGAGLGIAAEAGGSGPEAK